MVGGKDIAMYHVNDSQILKDPELWINVIDTNGSAILVH